jgi:hypothetical protein
MIVLSFFKEKNAKYVVLYSGIIAFDHGAQFSGKFRVKLDKNRQDKGCFYQLLSFLNKE